MKPGQPVMIAPGTGDDFTPQSARVALVADGEVVLQLDEPRADRFVVQSGLNLRYRDEAGDHAVTARVVAAQGTGRLRVALPVEGAGPAEERRHVRVEHLLRMEYQVIAGQEIEELRAQVLDGPRILKYEWSPGLPRQTAGAENEPVDPEWIETPDNERLTRIERKLDLLLERLGVESPRSSERPFFNVSLSASGLRFRDFQRRCQTGDVVYVSLELPLNPTVEVCAIAETLHVVEDLRQWNLSTGRDVVLEFRVIKDESRDLIERYCQQFQSIQRTA